MRSRKGGYNKTKITQGFDTPLHHFLSFTCQSTTVRSFKTPSERNRAAARNFCMAFNIRCSLVNAVNQSDRFTQTQQGLLFFHLSNQHHPANSPGCSTVFIHTARASAPASLPGRVRPRPQLHRQQTIGPSLRLDRRAPPRAARFSCQQRIRQIYISSCSAELMCLFYAWGWENKKHLYSKPPTSQVCGRRSEVALIKPSSVFSVSTFPTSSLPADTQGLSLCFLVQKEALRLLKCTFFFPLFLMELFLICIL